MIIRKTLKIENEEGLHMKPASMFVSEAGKFKSKIFVSKDNMKVNAKSIIGVMMLAAVKGSTITIEAEGEDAEEALKSLEDLVVRRKFNEG